MVIHVRRTINLTKNNEQNIAEQSRSRPAKTSKLKCQKGKYVSLGAVTIFCLKRAGGREEAKLSSHSQGQFFNLRMKIV